jgi:putative ABC transport system substrate-binding protein
VFAARKPATIQRVGYLHPAAPDDPGQAFVALVAALAELGYVAGRNIRFEERWAEGKLARLAAFAAELVRLPVDLIVAVSPPAIRAAQKATSTIPIVMAFSGDDPVKLGFVATLAHPGGNITGMTSLTSDVAPKWIELLQDAIPGIARIAVLRSSDRPDHDEHVRILQAAADERTVQLHVVAVSGPEQYAAAFEDMARQRDEAVIILSGPEYAEHLKQLAELAIAHRLGSLWQYKDFVHAGGLLSYGPSIRSLSADAASFVDKILRGARPGDLPVRQPTKFERAVNLKTAAAIGLAIPRAVVLSADEVIQ